MCARTYTRLLDEVNQNPIIRKSCYIELEKLFNKRIIISYFTSFDSRYGIDDEDANMIEEILQNTEGIYQRGLTLIINSPGGGPLAAERIVKVCRSYSNDNFEVVVANKAKSAATIICLGSYKIYMGETSELGPIDPQYPVLDQRSGNWRLMSAHAIISSYENLFGKAENCGDKRIEPYLQQLGNYDPREIAEIKESQDLSENIAIKLLRSGMLKEKSEEEIRKGIIGPFLDPKMTKSHGRPIYFSEAQNAGLTVEALKPHDKKWNLIWDLFMKLKFVVGRQFQKIVESKSESMFVPKASHPSSEE